MYRVRVHVQNEFVAMDNHVWVDITLPVPPRTGETLFLDGKLRKELESKATSSLYIAGFYAPMWFYRKSYDCKNPKEENLEDLSFEDALDIVRIVYNSNDEVIYIEIGRNDYK